MEEVRGTRTWRKKPHGTTAVATSAFDDVFGGPPRHTAPFSVRIEDYSEVFGAAASISSIPVLDLPPADDGFDAAGNVGRRGGLDYSEIFGGLGDGDFAVSYEELFAGPKRSGISSMGRRVPRCVLSEEQANDNTVHSLEGYSKDHVANLEMGLFSIDKHSDDVSSKQFSMSYHKTSQKIIDDVVSAKIHTTKLDAIPGFTIVVDANDPLPEMKSKAVNGGIAKNTDAKRYIPDGGQENEALFNYPFSAKNSVNLKADQKSSGPDYASILDVPGNEKQHSRSSSYHSTSSGDIPFFDAEYLKVSEISLQTKPLQGPPPSRPPPMLIKKPEHPDMMHAISRSDVEEGRILKPKLKNQLHLSSDATEIHAIDESVKDHTCCYDAELVPSSAAAASAAAIKEAMEQAQARLKRAKELMDRKRDKHHRKVDQAKVMNGKEDVAFYEIELKSFGKVVTANNLLKENNSINECKFLEKEEIRSAEKKIVLNQEEKKRQLHSFREDQQQVRQDNGFKSSEVTFKLDEITGESKSEKNFCELISNDGLLNAIEDVYILGNEKKAKPAIYAFQDKEKDGEKGEQNLEYEENQKLSEASCSVEMLEIDNHLNCAKMSCMKESDKTFVDAIMEEVLPINNASKLEEAIGSKLMDENQKPSDVPLDDTAENEVNKPNSVVHSCLCKGNEKRLQASNIDFKIGVDKASLGEREFKAAEEVSRNVDYKEELNVTYMICGLNDSDKELKVANGTVLQSRFEKEIRVPDGRCKYNPSDTMEVAEETKPCNNNDDVTKSMKHQCSHELNRFKFEESYNVAEEEGDGLQTNEGTCISAENELEQEAIHDSDGLEKLKAQGKQKDAAIELLTSRKETSWEYCNDKETKHAQMELQEDEEWMGARTNQVPQNFDFLTATDGDCAKRESENITEVPVICKLKENQISSNLADEVCQEVDIEKSDTEKVALSRKEGNSPANTPDATEVSHVEVTENSKHSLHSEEKENRKRMDMERERDKELVAQLEEKEREREREKDRIAVERANFEARQRALAEARERAERIAVERATAEARQRALAEALEKAEKAAEAEKVSRELRLKAERAAVGRATEEARQRAIEKALAEKAAAEARSRMRKDNARLNFKVAYIKEDSETRQKFYSTEIPRNTESAASSTNGQRYAESSSNGESESNLRCKARQERQQRTAERAAKALAEKNTRDILAQREQAERDRFADSLDIEVRRWSSGKDGNLRALLSTLQYILGPDSGWKPISLTDVITAAAVKKAYRKATLRVHPDKLQQRGATIQQKYICGKVFDLLKEAWSRFNSEER